MNAEMIVSRATELGITLSAAGDKIRYSPKSRTPEDFINVLRNNKAEVLAYLQQKPGDFGISELLAWASQLAEQELVLAEPIKYIERELVPVTTIRISWYAGEYLKTILRARLNQQNGGRGQFTPEWWREREEEALKALANLRQALNDRSGTTS